MYSLREKSYTHYLYTSGKFSDLEVTLKDSETEIKLNLHKSILFITIPYFKYMLSEFKESTEPTITIHVDNAKIARTIIENCYGIDYPVVSDWKYAIEFHQCYNFLDLNSLDGLDHHEYLVKILINY